MNKIELLLPAGNKEKLEYAIRYGADAVYLGLVDFSLRAMRKGELITLDNLKSSVDLAHQLKKKAYLTLNIFAFNRDIKLLENSMERISESKPDALIMSDIGIMRTARRFMPDIPIHVSTQTSTLNYEAVKFWQDFGAVRTILGREVTINDMAEIKRRVPDMELEVFIHGAQCVSFSGRCLISDYMTNGERKANQGNCCQPCRWSYKLVEETRPGQYYEIEQNERGTHIMSTKDLCLVNHLAELIDAGVDSLKVEGRTKSLYYVSAVAKTYREAIDAVYKDKNADMSPYFNELLKVGNRGYTTGFYLGGGEYPNDGYSYDISKGLAGADFLCEIFDKKDEYYKIRTKNKFYINTDIEIISPTEKFTAQALEIKSFDGQNREFANTNDELFVKFNKPVVDYKYAIVRTMGIKNYEN
ncbi:MAG: U32 family peptidase [Candidatus Gastranaerophilales bacterium]|nr:U32 family peptidase [Candidatus Gastranaerophilales bacterium]